MYLSLPKKIMYKYMYVCILYCIVKVTVVNKKDWVDKNSKKIFQREMIDSNISKY